MYISCRSSLYTDDSLNRVTRSLDTGNDSVLFTSLCQEFLVYGAPCFVVPPTPCVENSLFWCQSGTAVTTTLPIHNLHRSWHKTPRIILPSVIPSSFERVVRQQGYTLLLVLLWIFLRRSYTIVCHNSCCMHSVNGFHPGSLVHGVLCHDL